MQDLIKKSRIFISKGRILMGTIDETGTLKEDEVFIQCTIHVDDDTNMTKITSSKHFIVDKCMVVIAKNPCMHPGDARVLNAVDVPQLRHMIDVVVFPADGKRCNCKNIFTSEPFKHGNMKIDLNESMLFDGFGDYLDEANDLYLKYRNEMERIIHYFDCTNETELLVGLYLNSHQSQEAKDFFKLSSSMIKNLWSNMRQLYLESINKHKLVSNIKLKMASAWYYACNTSKLNKKMRILSFPWILEDILIQNKFENIDFFNRSLLIKYTETQNDYQCVSRYIEKVQLCREISEIIGHKVILTVSFGLFLFEDNIDAKLIVYEPNYESIGLNLINAQMKDIFEDNFDNVSFSNFKIST